MCNKFQITNRIIWEYEDDMFYKYTGYVGLIHIFTIVQVGNKFELWIDLPGESVRDYEFFETIEEVMHKAYGVMENWLVQLGR